MLRMRFSEEETILGFSEENEAVKMNSILCIIKKNIDLTGIFLEHEIFDLHCIS